MGGKEKREIVAREEGEREATAAAVAADRKPAVCFSGGGDRAYRFCPP